MAWIDRHPDDLIERSDPSQALDWLRQQTTLDEAALGKLDLFLHHWVLVMLQRPTDAQGVLDLMSLCQVARSRAAATPGGDTEAMGQRWQAFEDLLEAKRLTLRAAAAEPVTPLRHEPAIRQFIQAQAQQRATQTALATHLGLSAGRVSQILGVLESRGQVVRQRLGQENWVSWPAQAGAQPAPNQPSAKGPTNTTATSPRLGMQVFGRLAA
jgi:hypothetical protein